MAATSTRREGVGAAEGLLVLSIECTVRLVFFEVVLNLRIV